jgi:hypothetical protein
MVLSKCCLRGQCRRDGSWCSGELEVDALSRLRCRFCCTREQGTMAPRRQARFRLQHPARTTNRSSGTTTIHRVKDNTCRCYANITNTNTNPDGKPNRSQRTSSDTPLVLCKSMDRSLNWVAGFKKATSPFPAPPLGQIDSIQRYTIHVHNITSCATCQESGTKHGPPYAIQDKLRSVNEIWCWLSALEGNRVPGMDCEQRERVVPKSKRSLLQE